MQSHGTPNFYVENPQIKDEKSQVILDQTKLHYDQIQDTGESQAWVQIRKTQLNQSNN